MLKKILTTIQNYFNKNKTPSYGTTISLHDNSWLYQDFYNAELSDLIRKIKEMDNSDPRVKKIHVRTAREVTNGGLEIIFPEKKNKKILKKWSEFKGNIKLDLAEKLESDCRGLLIEGNLPLQWVVNNRQVVSCVRMPSETIVPLTNEQGTIKDFKAAYHQYDPTKGKVVHIFPYWQLTLARLSPMNYDDLGSLGKPYLSSVYTLWQKLKSLEDDLILRRKTRAPLRISHHLEGATHEDLESYRNDIDMGMMRGNFTDYITNKKGSITPIQGDANLSDIGDILYVLDTFFSGAPGPKGLFGFPGDLARDILEKLTADFYSEVDSIQQVIADAYQSGFCLHLLLAGLDPDRYQFEIRFKKKRTETPNQRADLALKYQALHVDQITCWETAGLSADSIQKRLDEQQKKADPYPVLTQQNTNQPNVSITPGNAPQGESMTSITN